MPVVPEAESAVVARPVLALAFEGLFLRGLEPTSALLALLRDAGYDASAPKKSYPVEVWRGCIEAARLHLYPQLSVEDGQRRLGAHFVEGIAKTLVGSVLAVSAPLLGPERSLDRVGTYMRIAHQATEVTQVVTGLRQRRVLMRSHRSSPHFFAGALEAVLRLTRVEPTCEVLRAEADAFEISASWR